VVKKGKTQVRGHRSAPENIAQPWAPAQFIVLLLMHPMLEEFEQNYVSFTMLSGFIF